MFFEKKYPLALGISITIIAYFFFAVGSAFVRALASFPAIEIVFFQNLFCLIAILPFLFSQRSFSLKTSFIFTHFTRDFSGIASYFTYFLAIQALPLVDATVLSYTSPFYIPFLTRITFKEKIAKEAWWAIIFGLIGIIIVLQPTKDLFSSGSWIALLSGFLTAIALISIRTLNRKKEPLLRTLFYFFLSGILFTLPFMFLSWKNPSNSEWLLLLGIGGCTAIGQVLLTTAYQYGTASFLSPLSYFVVLFAALFGWIYFAQPMGAASLLGTALVIAGGTLSFILGKKKKSFEEIFIKKK